MRGVEKVFICHYANDLAMSQQDEATLNIGALSMATGVPVETIRTWERRYGFPKSQRNDAGHRIYGLDTIEHLRLITAILARGYRPSQLEGQTREELEELLAKTTGDEAGTVVDGTDDEQVCQAWIDCWMEAVTSLDREGFEGYLRGEFSRMNALEFLRRRIDPFLEEIGDGWASGRLSVLHEHFASECIRDFLVAAWRKLSDVAGGPKVVLATFSGEQHCLGLHMAALTLAIAECRVVFLGANTPVEDIAGATVECQADAVALSISEYANSAASVSFLSRLREFVDPQIEVIVGGRGAPSDVAQVHKLEGLEELFEYFEE